MRRLSMQVPTADTTAPPITCIANRTSDDDGASEAKRARSGNDPLASAHVIPVAKTVPPPPPPTHQPAQTPQTPIVPAIFAAANAGSPPMPKSLELLWQQLEQMPRGGQPNPPLCPCPHCPYTTGPLMLQRYNLMIKLWFLEKSLYGV